MQLDKERRFLAQRQHTLLNHGAFHIIVLYNHILLEYLNSIQLLATFTFRQKHLQSIKQSNKTQVVLVSNVSITLPKEPLPSTLMKLKSVARIMSFLA